MENLSLTILHEEDSFLALDKPSGLSVHNNEDASNLLKALQRLRPGSQFYPVHRLDKETSGVQVLALEQRSARELAEEFQSRRVEKIYLGIVRGSLPTEGGLWNQPLSDKSEGWKNPAGLKAARVPCETRYRVVKRNKYFSLCEFDLLTGRQHQIRKHCALARHPLIGDLRYGEKGYNSRMAKIYRHSRMFLHCHSLKLGGRQIIAPVPDSFGKLVPDS